MDGTFKNSPGNIWYNENDHIWVESVENEVKIGKLAGNRNLAYGVKNILEEFLQEKGLDLSPDASQKLQVKIVFYSDEQSKVPSIKNMALITPITGISNK